MSVLVYVILAIGIFMTTWGAQTRGTLSPAVFSIGGILWLISVVWAFLELGIGKGLLFLLGTFVAGAILSKLLPKKV